MSHYYEWVILLKSSSCISTIYIFHCYKYDLIHFNSIKDVQLEDPLVAIMLFSLCGVNCITTNQWYTSVQQGTEQMKYILKGNDSMYVQIH